MDRSHYELDGFGGIEIRPAATNETCIVYLLPGDDTLCVMEGHAFHHFKINELGMKRLASELNKRIWDKAIGK